MRGKRRPSGQARRAGGRRDPRRALGRRGEAFAAAHLERLGWRILERNARTRCGEIDLIGLDGATLVFVEIKTLRARSAAEQGPGAAQPLAGLRGAQRARVRRLAVAWLADRSHARPTARTIRFDAVGVLLSPRGTLLRLDHLEGAW